MDVKSAESATASAAVASSAGNGANGVIGGSIMTAYTAVRDGRYAVRSSSPTTYSPHVARRARAPAPVPSPWAGLGGTVTGWRDRINQPVSRRMRLACMSYARPSPSSWACVISMPACPVIRRSNKARVNSGRPVRSTLPSLSSLGFALWIYALPPYTALAASRQCRIFVPSTMSATDTFGLRGRSTTISNADAADTRYFL